MLNLMRGELYKLFRSKCFYVCSIVLIVLVLLMYGMYSLVDIAEREEGMAGNAGLTVSVEIEQPLEENVWEIMDVVTIVQGMFSSMGSLLGAIFTAIFVCGEYANGAIKNIVGKGYGRWKVFMSKYLSCIVGVVVMELIMLVAILLCELLILHGNRLNTDLFLPMLNYVGIQLILVAAQTGIIVMFNQFFRSIGVGIAVSVCLIMFSAFATSLLNALLNYFKIKIDACEYWILDMIGDCPTTNITGEIWGHNALWSMVWIVLTIGIGILHYRKADVK